MKIAALLSNKPEKRHTGRYKAPGTCGGRCASYDGLALHLAGPVAVPLAIPGTGRAA